MRSGFLSGATPSVCFCGEGFFVGRCCGGEDCDWKEARGGRRLSLALRFFDVLQEKVLGRAHLKARARETFRARRVVAICAVPENRLTA